MRTAPEIRFKDYSETWEQDQLSSLFHFSNGFNGSAELYGKGVPFISVLDILNNDYITYDNIRGRVSIDKSTLSRFAVEYGDVVFQRSSENREDAGSSNVYIGDKPVAFGGFVIRGKKTTDNDDAIFMKNLLDSKSVREQISSKAQGAQHINVSQETLSDVLVKKPGKEEQEKIGKLLYRIDLLISAQQKKNEKLIALKKAMLDKMFPHEGEKYPEIRFNGFTEPWEQRKLDECVDRIATGLNPRDNFKLNTGGSNYYVTIKNFEHGHLFLDDSCDKVDDDAFKKIQERSDLQKDDILFTSIGRVGDCYLIETTPTNWNINESVFSLRPNQSVVIPEYLFQTIHCDVVLNQILNNITGSTFKSIKIGDLKKASIPVPNKEEQRKIGSFISYIDNLITLHQRKLQSLKSFKSAMTSKMFV